MVSVDGVKRKICLIGDWGVGKTSLIKKFVLDQFDDSYLATFGSKVYKKRLIYNDNQSNITNLNLMIWDVMGQPEFKQMRMIAYSGSQGAMIVCDLTRKQSLFNHTFRTPE
jgi:GTPase SAR1 family protein